MEKDRHSKIRQRAYEIWDREGRQHGRADEHWLQAEREIAAQDDARAAAVTAETAAAPAKKKAPAKKTSNGATKPPAASLRSGQRTRRGSQPLNQN